MITSARSFLFVPGNRPDRFAKAAASGAHAVILDLEDAVGPAEKPQARDNVVAWLRFGGRGIVRINGADTAWFLDDLDAIAGAATDAIMMPKATAQSVGLLSERLTNVSPVIALIENAEGLCTTSQLAQTRHVVRLAFGNLDFSSDMGIAANDDVLDMARFQIALHSRAAGLPAPIDGVSTQIDDPVAVEADVARSRKFGFSGKLCIHPAQVKQVNAGFAPSSSEISWARRVILALEHSAGTAVQLDGKMIDKPLLARAQAILADWEIQSAAENGIIADRRGSELTDRIISAE